MGGRSGGSPERLDARGQRRLEEGTDEIQTALRAVDLQLRTWWNDSSTPSPLPRPQVHTTPGELAASTRKVALELRRLGEGALVVSATGPLDPEELVTHAARALARYKLPKQVLFVEEVPRTPAGKADHRTAHAMAEQRRPHDLGTVERSPTR